MTMELVPGLKRLRPDDHFMILAETDASPMHVGALILLEVPEDKRAGLLEQLRNQFSDRLPGTPLQVRLIEAPGGFDSDVWAEVAQLDLETYVTRPDVPTPDMASLYTAVAELNMVRLDLGRAPFMAYLLDSLPGNCAALYLKVHHSVADGIGFQEILRLLSDEVSPSSPRSADAELPGPQEWMAIAQARFAAEETIRAAQSAKRKQALTALETLNGARAETPVLKLSAPTSGQRNYATMSISLATFKRIAKALDATVNDLFLACAGTALRNYLMSINDLPATPIVVNSARSYRRSDHAGFGNRIVALHPHLATNIADPIDRLRTIQASMTAEMQRTIYDEALLDALEKPFGPRDRRIQFEQRLAKGGRVLPGNVTLSNVPGPAGERSFAGYRQLHNFPVPIIGSGRFLNITSRRNGPNLDMGVIADAEKIADAGQIATLFVEASIEYEALSCASQRLG